MIDINGSYVTTLSGFVPSPFQNYENLYSASFPRRELKPKAGRLAAGGGFKLRFLLAAKGFAFLRFILPTALLTCYGSFDSYLNKLS